MSVLEQPKALGGLGLIPVNAQLFALRARWWSDLARQDPPKWASAATFLIDENVKKDTGFNYAYIDKSWNQLRQIQHDWTRRKIEVLKKLPLETDTEQLLESAFFWSLPPTLLYPNISLKSKSYIKIWKDMGTTCMQDFFAKA